MADAALDNDVLFKAACYGLLDELLAALPESPYEHGILGSAKFVLRKLIRKRPPIRAELAIKDLERALTSLETLEPTEEEVELSAELEFEAQRQHISLHAGECLLCAILWQRNLRHLLTGDKNAINALAILVLPSKLNLQLLDGKLICMEQAMLWMLRAAPDPTEVRAAVCAERDVDSALRICFSCASPEVGVDSWMEGLSSNVEDLRKRVGAILAPDIA